MFCHLKGGDIMAKQEYFIDEHSKNWCETLSQIQEANMHHIQTLPPVFKIDDSTVVCVDSDSFNMKVDFYERVFSYEVTFEDPGVPFKLTIENGISYLPKRLYNYVWNMDYLCIALTWENLRDNNVNIFIFIFYDKKGAAMLRFDGEEWIPVGPASVMHITGDYNEPDDLSYTISYNNYDLPGSFDCGLQDGNGFGFELYDEFGINWLVNALAYRNEYLDN